MYVEFWCTASIILSSLTTDLITLPPKLECDVSLFNSLLLLLLPSSAGLNRLRKDWTSAAFDSFVVGTYRSVYLTGELGLLVYIYFKWGTFIKVSLISFKVLNYLRLFSISLCSFSSYSCFFISLSGILGRYFDLSIILLLSSIDLVLKRVS